MTITINIPFSPVPVLLGLLFIVDLLLAYRVWIGNRKNVVNIFYALAVLMAALWTGGLLGDALAIGTQDISILTRFIYITPILAVFFFYIFTYYFPYKTYTISKSLVLLLLAFTIISLTIVIIPGAMIPLTLTKLETLRFYYNRIGYAIYSLYFILFTVLAFKNLLIKYKTSDGIWRKRIKQVLIGTSVAFIGGGLFNLILPMICDSYVLGGYLAPFFTFFTAVYIWYHIFWKSKQIQK